MADAEIVFHGVVYLTQPEADGCYGCVFNNCVDRCSEARDRIDCNHYGIIFVKKIVETKSSDKIEWKVDTAPVIPKQDTINLTKQELKAVFLSWDKTSSESIADEFVDHVLKTKDDFAKYLKLKEQFKGL